MCWGDVYTRVVERMYSARTITKRRGDRPYSINMNGNYRKGKVQGKCELNGIVAL